MSNNNSKISRKQRFVFLLCYTPIVGWPWICSHINFSPGPRMTEKPLSGQHRSLQQGEKKDIVNHEMALSASVGSATHHLHSYFIGQSISHDQACLNRQKNV